MLKQNKILVIGCNGQIGTVLTNTLADKFGCTNVIGTDLQPPIFDSKWCYVQCSVLDRNGISNLIKTHQINEVYLLAAYLSAKGEGNIEQAWDLNINGLLNILQLAKEYKVSKVFWPSSIAVFGPSTPKKNVDQNAICEPNTIYGVSKLAGEKLCNYYFNQHGIDIRSLRYPGLIGWESLPGGGTTDYAVEIFHHAVESKKYTCFLSKTRTLPMMYMNDAIEATIRIMSAEYNQIKIRTSYNISSFNFSPYELELEIKKHVPGFSVNYVPDKRDKVAQGWPQSISDLPAQRDWGWQSKYNMSQMVSDIMLNLKKSKKI